jgi:acyl-CoA dehydrogenase
MEGCAERMYELSDKDLEIQRRARAFADELIPFEKEAGLAGGELPPGVAAKHAARARELGPYAANMRAAG